MPQTAIVTGAGKGIGRAIALRLAAIGYDLFLLGRDAGALSAVTAECVALSAQADSLAGDLRESNYIDAALRAVRARFGPIDVLINNAGTSQRGAVQDVNLDAWRAVLELNFGAVMALTRSALPEMIERRRGAVINISSISGRHTNAGSAIYAASKHALNGFTGCLFEDVREFGIKVSSIMPGFVDTALTAGLGRRSERMIRPKDIADAVAYVLASSAHCCPTEIVIRPPESADLDGEIAIRGPIVMQGYHNRPDVNAVALAGGWLHTGDLGYLDRGGRLVITGRMKEIIVLASGKNIYPEEVEAQYAKSPFIKELCVLGVAMPGEPSAERLHAVVVRTLERRRHPALLGGTVDDREIKLLFRGIEGCEQVEHLVHHLVVAFVGPVDLVNAHDGPKTDLEGLLQHELGLRHGAFGGIDQQHRTIHHVENAFDFAAEIGVARRVDDVDARLFPVERGHFGQDGDAALALEIVRIHGALGHFLVLAERAGLGQQPVDQRGFAVVDVGNNRDVAQIHRAPRLS